MRTIIAPPLPGSIVAPQLPRGIIAPRMPTTTTGDGITVPGSVLHMDGADASTTFTDQSGKTWTANGSAQIDTAQSKFGGASGLFPGADGDYISSPAHADWWLDDGLDASLWTLAFWLRFSSVGDPVGFVQQVQDNQNNWTLFQFAGALHFRVRVASVNTVDISQLWTPSTSTWYHVAVVKNGAAGYMHFIDGTQIGSTTPSSANIPDFASQIQVGRMTRTTGAFGPLTGWMDELAIEKGIARWTSNFTPPTSAHSTGSVVLTL